LDKEHVCDGGGEDERVGWDGEGCRCRRELPRDEGGSVEEGGVKSYEQGHCYRAVS
jgi:hypothetical protein